MLKALRPASASADHVVAFFILGRAGKGSGGAAAADLENLCHGGAVTVLAFAHRKLPP